MSLLDDLKKQANQENAKKEESSSKTVQKHHANWILLLPKMQLIITYMKELADNLNALNLDDKVDYPLTKNVMLNNLKKENYRVRKADEQSVRDISLRYDITGERNVEVTVNNDNGAENIRSFLRNQKARFSEAIAEEGKVKFKILPKITVIFQYLADVQNSQVILRIYNFDRPEKQEIKYKPEAITEELMEETAKYILNKENKFRALSGNDIDAETLKNLRDKLKQDGKIKAKIQNNAVIEKQETKTQKKSLFGKLLKK